MSGQDAGALPAEPGAYALDLTLERACAIAIPALGSPRLAPGRYVYLGSARGPGGIRARAGRHLASRKKRRWHIDHLTARAVIRDAVGLSGARECDLVDALRAHAGVSVPVPGMGSSDCRRCPAHLLEVPPDLDLRSALAQALEAP